MIKDLRSYPNNMKNWEFDKKGGLNLSQAKPSRLRTLAKGRGFALLRGKQAHLNKLCDARRLKDSGCPTQSKTNSSCCLVISLLILMVVLSVPLRGNTKEEKYKVSVCTIFKNEELHLKEWIEYHRLIGVEHFYLYNNSSEDHFEKVLRPYLKEGLITLIHWPDRTAILHSEESAAHWALSTQLLAYGHATKWLCPKETKWLVFLDVDEFLVPVKEQSLSEILECYDEFSGIQISSDYFEASNSAHALPSRDLLITTVELTDQPAQRIETSVEKMIIKLEGHTTFIWPPLQYAFKDGSTAKKVSHKELRINKYVNRFKPIWKFEKIKNKFDVDNRLLTEEEKKQIFELGYEIEDKEKPIFKFIPQLRKKMGLE